MVWYFTILCRLCLRSGFCSVGIQLMTTPTCATCPAFDPVDLADYAYDRHLQDLLRNTGHCLGGPPTQKGSNWRGLAAYPRVSTTTKACMLHPERAGAMVPPDPNWFSKLSEDEQEYERRNFMQKQGDQP